MDTTKISLAPLAYYWSKENTLSFYADAMKWPVDIVYLGEVVCSRRHLMKLDDWFELANEMRSSGKEVVMSTQTLIDSDSDRRTMHRLIERAVEANIDVEANDFSAVRVLHRHQKKFIAGPHLNIYHTDTLNWLQSMGAKRFLPPLEMSGIDLAELQRNRSTDMETEVAVWGRMALAFSARCFTARHHRLRKDNCEFRCESYPDGLSLATREQKMFLNLNGIQTQSATCLDLAEQLPLLFDMNVDVIRLQPQSQHMEKIVSVFDRARTDKTTAITSESLLPFNAERCNGYWFGAAGMQYQPSQPC